MNQLVCVGRAAVCAGAVAGAAVLGAAVLGAWAVAPGQPGPRPSAQPSPRGPGPGPVQAPGRAPGVTPPQVPLQAPPLAPAQPAPRPSPEEEEALAREMAQVRPEHQWLRRQCGEFKVKLTISPEPGGEAITLSATAKREMMLGGKFMIERLSCKDGPAPYDAMTITGFNPDAEGGPRFEIVRYSSMVMCTMPEEGRWDEGARTMTSVGVHQVSGMNGRIRVVTRHPSDDASVSEVFMAMEGYSEQFRGVKTPEYKAMEIRYERDRTK